MFLCVQDAIIIPTSRDTVEDIYDRTPNHREIYPFAIIMTLTETQDENLIDQLFQKFVI